VASASSVALWRAPRADSHSLSLAWMPAHAPSSRLRLSETEVAGRCSGVRPGFAPRPRRDGRPNQPISRLISCVVALIVGRAVAGEKYRFLLRMPQDLRGRLSQAAARSGRSLNAEIVCRLDRSLRRSMLRRTAEAAISLLPRATLTNRRGKGRMSNRSIRRPVLIAALVGLAIAAVISWPG
jgi:hypothetical protein